MPPAQVNQPRSVRRYNEWPLSLETPSAETSDVRQGLNHPDPANLQLRRRGDFGDPAGQGGAGAGHGLRAGKAADHGLD